MIYLFLLLIQTVRLADLLDEAKNRCKVSIRERREERGELIDDDELDKNAGIMGYAAVKYMDLKSNRKSDYKWVIDLSLTLLFTLNNHYRDIILAMSVHDVA